MLERRGIRLLVALSLPLLLLGSCAASAASRRPDLGDELGSTVTCPTLPNRGFADSDSLAAVTSDLLSPPTDKTVFLSTSTPVPLLPARARRE